jgi:hypothetical protein
MLGSLLLSESPLALVKGRMAAFLAKPNLALVVSADRSIPPRLARTFCPDWRYACRQGLSTKSCQVSSTCIICRHSNNHRSAKHGSLPQRLRAFRQPLGEIHKQRTKAPFNIHCASARSNLLRSVHLSLREYHAPTDRRLVFDYVEEQAMQGYQERTTAL